MVLSFVQSADTTGKSGDEGEAMSSNRKELHIILMEISYNQTKICIELGKIGDHLASSGKVVSESIGNIQMYMETVNELSERYQKLIDAVLKE